MIILQARPRKPGRNNANPRTAEGAPATIEAQTAACLRKKHDRPVAGKRPPIHAKRIGNDQISPHFLLRACASG
jgi:hypothetical protein